MTSERGTEHPRKRLDHVARHEARGSGRPPSRRASAPSLPAAAAIRGSSPLERNAAMIPVSTSPVPAVARAGRPGQTIAPCPGAPTSVPEPFSRTTQPNRSTAWSSASSRWASTHEDSTPSRRASSPECGVSTVGAFRSNGSSSKRASASTTAGRSVSSSSRRTSALSPSPRPRPGPSASAPARPTASNTSSSGRFTASSTSVSSTGIESLGAAIAT